MPRLFGAFRRLSATLVASCVLVSGLLAGMPRARAAMITDVADAAEPHKTIDVHIDLRYRHDSHSATIGREEANGTQIYNASELSYSHMRDTLEAALTIGLYHDLELHIIAPYVIDDSQSWNYSTINGKSVEPTSTVAHNTQNASGATQDANGAPLFPTGQPLFPVPGQVARGGFGDPTIGLTWGIFNEQRDAHLPSSWYPSESRTATWVVGIDYTIPVAPVMDPSVTQPGNTNANPLPVGEGAHKLDFWTAMSKRFGIVEPFFKLHYTLAVAASNAYDNCSIVGKDPNQMIMAGEGQGACDPVASNPFWTQGQDAFWTTRNKLEPSQVGGLLFGTEFHPIEHGASGPNLDIALQFQGDYVSKGRNYSELSDVLHKLTYTDQYFSLAGELVMDLQFAKYVHWVSYATVGTDTTHFITDETVGIARSANPNTQYVHLDNPQANEVNPSYDFRLDAPGHRFIAMNVFNFTVSTGLSFTF